MVEVKAYIRQVMVDDVVDALSNLEAVNGVAVMSLKEYGHSARDGSLQRMEMTRLEVDVPEAEGQVVDCLVNNARTGGGHPGDGRVFVSRLSHAVRVADGREEDGISTL